MFGIGIWYPNHECNVGTLFRSGYAFGANFLFTIGKKYKRQGSDTPNSTKHIPYIYFEDYNSFKKSRPTSPLIVVEITERAYDLPKFVHPPTATYLLGSEGGNLPKEVLDKAYAVVKMNTRTCLNLATAGSIVLYDRIAKCSK